MRQVHEGRSERGGRLPAALVVFLAAIAAACSRDVPAGPLQASLNPGDASRPAVVRLAGISTTERRAIGHQIRRVKQSGGRGGPVRRLGRRLQHEQCRLTPRGGKCHPIRCGSDLPETEPIAIERRDRREIAHAQREVGERQTAKEPV